MIRAYTSIDDAWQALRDYLGERFCAEFMSFRAACKYSEQEASRLGSRFYPESDAYLYELTHFHFSGFKDGFFHALLTYAREAGIESLADIGCGVALDAQALLQMGFDVVLFDIPSPSTAYAEWRLRRDLGVHSPVSPIDALQPSADRLAYLVDVLEHTPQPGPLLTSIARAYDHICLNLFPHSSAPQIAVDLHYPTNHRTLLPILDATHQLVLAAPSAETVTLIWRRRHA